MDNGQKPRKSEETKAKIVQAALDLFREQGYDETTMRMVAARAGVSVGNAYYYFESKEALMQGYFDEIQRRFADEVAPVLARETSFEARLVAALMAWTVVARPYHRFAEGLFRYASRPTSSMSPFSVESAPARAMAIDVYRQVIDGSPKLRMAPELRERLPELLWMYQMGVVLYWVYDTSTEQKQTETLIRRTAPIVARLIGLSRLPVLRGTAAEVIRLIDDLTPQARTTHD